MFYIFKPQSTPYTFYLKKFPQMCKWNQASLSINKPIEDLLEPFKLQPESQIQDKKKEIHYKYTKDSFIVKHRLYHHHGHSPAFHFLFHFFIRKILTKIGEQRNKGYM
eukprot:TRINITY_DN1120_c0_g1_i5.p4 TRINITY_DN1120_c0_g1~~TRINITY_DN1120_c0_g1_i5.p4  ORF type:complete len:108 (+),score=0.95 TRINITY_DN1120_c0_g1_i5:170-493(+)